MQQNERDLYAKLLADCFLNDPGIQIQLAGVPDASDVLEMQCRCQLSAFLKLNGVSTFGDGEGLIMGYCSRDQVQLSAYLQEESAVLLKQIPHDVLAGIQKNAERVVTIVQSDWYEKFLGTQDVYVIQAIAVHPSVRGTGIFRKLLTPILGDSAEQGMPVVLQTHEPVNITKYEHMGFVLKETVSSDVTDLACYNLMKYP